MKRGTLNTILYILILSSGTFTAWSILCPAPMRANIPSIKSYATDFWWDINLRKIPLNIVIEANLTSYHGKAELWQVELYYTSEVYGGYEVRIYGVLLYPKGRNNLPGILLIHGYGNNIEQMFPHARFLASNDYAVLVIDEPGHGRSTKLPQPTPNNIVNVTHGPLGSYLSHATIAALRGLEVLKKQEFINGSNLGVCGVNMGGIISFIVGRLDWDVKAIVPIIAAGNYLLTIASGGLANTLIPVESKLSSREVIDLCRYFDVLAYARELNKGVLMLTGTNDEFLPLEAINETYEIIPSKNKFISIAPNWGHYMEYDQWKNLILKFFNTYLKRWGVLSEPRITKEELNFPATTTYYISLEQPQNGRIFFRPALIGFPWIEAYRAAIIFSIIPSGVEYYAAGISNGNFETTTTIRIVGQNSYLAPLISIVAIGLLLLKTENRKGTAIKIGYWLTLLSSMFLPVVTVWDKFTLSIPHVIERYGILLGITHFAWILILIGVATTLILTLQSKFITASITQLVISLIALLIAISVIRLQEIAIPNTGFIIPIATIIIVLVEERRRKPKPEPELIKVIPPTKKEEEEYYRRYFG